MSLRGRLLTGTSAFSQISALPAPTPLFSGRSILGVVVNGRHLDPGEYRLTRSGNVETVTFVVAGRAA